MACGKGWVKERVVGREMIRTKIDGRGKSQGNGQGKKGRRKGRSREQVPPLTIRGLRPPKGEAE